MDKKVELKIAVLVTGTKSASATQLKWVSWALAKIANKYPNAKITCIHGACPTGADTHAGAVASALGWREHRMPADWGRDGRSAGFKRNARMVESVAACSADIKVCVAFPSKLAWKQHQEGTRPVDSRGTLHCLGLAQEAGLKCWVVPLSIEAPPSGPRVTAKARVRKTEPKVQSSGATPSASLVNEKSETRYKARSEETLTATVYTVAGTGYTWALDLRPTIEVKLPTGEVIEKRNPGYKKYNEYYEGRLERHSLPLKEVKKWLNPEMWE